MYTGDMKTFLNALALFIAAILLFGFIGMVLTPSDTEPISKEQERYYFMQGCEEAGDTATCGCIYDDVANQLCENHITDNIERMASGDFTDEEIAISANCWVENH